jgi:hypothetical protein
MSRTRVVHVKKEPFDVYIGRACQNYPEDSIFANVFKIGRDGTRHEVIEKYRNYAENSPAIREALECLRGKTLGCWCKPEECHGDVLVELLEGRKSVSSQLNFFD